MSMNDFERRLLQETHDSTISQEKMLEGMESRLKQGDERMADHARRILKNEGKILELDERASRQARIFKWLAGALAFPAGGWLWDHVILKMFGGKP